MRILSFLITFLLIPNAFPAKHCDSTNIVAVIDTGFGSLGNGAGAKLCKYGHKDFSKEQDYTYRYHTVDKVPYDNNGHGTNVVGLIEQYAGNNTNYCIVILKYYSSMQKGSENLASGAKAIAYAVKIGAKFINYSGGGPERSEEESRAVKTFLDKGGKFVAAAGNEHKNLDLIENAYYPAMADPRVTVVGNKNFYGAPALTSNYGKAVKVWEFGENQTAYGITQSGTSQATAITTGKMVSNTKNSCNIGSR